MARMVGAWGGGRARETVRSAGPAPLPDVSLGSMQGRRRRSPVIGTQSQL